MAEEEKIVDQESSFKENSLYFSLGAMVPSKAVI